MCFILQDGSIINIRPFDRERQDLYQFAVTAMDNAPLPRFGHTTVSLPSCKLEMLIHISAIFSGECENSG